MSFRLDCDGAFVELTYLLAEIEPEAKSIILYTGFKLRERFEQLLFVFLPDSNSRVLHKNEQVFLVIDLITRFNLYLSTQLYFTSCVRELYGIGQEVKNYLLYPLLVDVDYLLKVLKLI